MQMQNVNFSALRCVFAFAEHLLKVSIIALLCSGVDAPFESESCSDANTLVDLCVLGKYALWK